jgi:hypothetical protein
MNEYLVKKGRQIYHLQGILVETVGYGKVIKPEAGYYLRPIVLG